MPLDNTEHAYFERQVALARVIFAALSLVALLETSTAPIREISVVFLSGYLALALIGALIDQFRGEARVRIPLVVDFLALAVLLYLTPSVSAFWFLFLFAVFALATRGNTRAVLAFVAASTAAIIVRVAIETPFGWHSIWQWSRYWGGHACFRPGNGVSWRSGTRASRPPAVPRENYGSAAV